VHSQWHRAFPGDVSQIYSPAQSQTRRMHTEPSWRIGFLWTSVSGVPTKVMSYRQSKPSRRLLIHRGISGTCYRCTVAAYGHGTASTKQNEYNRGRVCTSGDRTGTAPLKRDTSWNGYKDSVCMLDFAPGPSLPVHGSIFVTSTVNAAPCSSFPLLISRHY